MNARARRQRRWVRKWVRGQGRRSLMRVWSKAPMPYRWSNPEQPRMRWLNLAFDE